MRVCIVAEGCYPFVVGGVSSWVHSLIQLFPETEFVILAIAANRSQRGKYAYELPKNVSAVYELYLDDVDWSGSKKLHRKRLKKEQYQALRSLILDQDIEWDVLFDLFQKENVSLNALLMGEDFLNAVRDCYNLKYSQIVFSDFLWTMRSIYLPLFLTMQTEIPRADLYHCVATGYAGVLGAMAKHFYGSRLLISEHGIYTREREEELIKAKWVEGIYKNIWSTTKGRSLHHCLNMHGNCRSNLAARSKKPWSRQTESVWKICRIFRGKRKKMKEKSTSVRYCV